MAETRSIEEVDVVVVGGGPGGATAATLVAMAGHRVLLLEKERFPRYQVGESLSPMTVHGIARLLGVDAKLHKAGFVRKRGTTLRWGSAPEPWAFPGTESSGADDSTGYAYQVDRSRFDALLLDNARRAGAAVREECVVNGIVRDGDRVEGVRYHDIVGREQLVRAQYVVDASGNGSRLYRVPGGDRVHSRFFRNIAVFGYYEGGHRLPSPYDGDTVCAAFDTGWLWYTPLADRRAAVGAVVNREHIELVRSGPRKALRELVAACPTVCDLLTDARPVTDGPYGQVRMCKDFSYSNTRFWSPGIGLVGDAASFVDPLSSGVHLAMYSGMLLARSVNSSLAGRVAEKRAFDEFEARYRHEYRLSHNFLVACYNMNADEPSYFWRSRRITRTRGSELVAFLNLVGGLASGDPSLRSSERTAANLDHAARILDRLGQGASVAELIGQSSVLDEIWERGESLINGARAGSFAEAEPMLADGLVATSDGLCWAEPAG